MNSSHPLAAGLRSLPEKGKQSFASTQAVWRFYKNEKVSLQQLSEPLLDAAHAGIGSQCRKYALCVHDWSRLNYRKHTSKEDRYQMTHKTDVGYDLQSSLIVSDSTGKPIAPVAQRILTKSTSYASYETSDKDERQSHLEEVTSCMKWIEA